MTDLLISMIVEVIKSMAISSLLSALMFGLIAWICNDRKIANIANIATGCFGVIFLVFTSSSNAIVYCSVFAFSWAAGAWFGRAISDSLELSNYS